MGPGFKTLLSLSCVHVQEAFQKNAGTTYEVLSAFQHD